MRSDGEAHGQDGCSASCRVDATRKVRAASSKTTVCRTSEWVPRMIRCDMVVVEVRQAPQVSAGTHCFRSGRSPDVTIAASYQHISASTHVCVVVVGGRVLAMTREPPLSRFVPPTIIPARSPECQTPSRPCPLCARATARVIPDS